MADRSARPPTGPGGADPEKVRTALRELSALGDRVVRNGALGSLTTYRVGGDAAILLTAKDRSDLTRVAAAVALSHLPVLVVGRGSNLLVADAGFGGIAVILDPTAFGGIRIEGSAVVAGAAVALPALARQSVEAALTGMEWAVGVPGSVGGGVRMNAGGHGSDIAHTLLSCHVVDFADGTGTERSMLLPDLHYGYRRSAIGPAQVVVDAEFGLAAGDPALGRDTIREIVRWRREHQPGGQNAGSVFTNPPGDPPGNSAGWLIDRAGCKGRRLGSAMVSTKHANFIQADAGGSANDVRALMDVIRAEVAGVHGVDLHPEVRMVGFHSELSTSGGGL
jgi:UDP-N-acetylmuramate dehydrogenase